MTPWHRAGRLDHFMEMALRRRQQFYLLREESRPAKNPTFDEVSIRIASPVPFQAAVESYISAIVLILAAQW